jgi:DNA-directed RNA polymerase subunit RPC12/RpoP
VSLFGGTESDRGGAGTTVTAHEERRRAVATTRLGTGTLACRRCDAPVALGKEPVPVTSRIVCPYCRHTAVVRDFLSLAAPTRPARVVVRVSLAIRAGQSNR